VSVPVIWFSGVSVCGLDDGGYLSRGGNESEDEKKDSQDRVRIELAVQKATDEEPDEGRNGQ
jgi:hypothetical protein